MSGFENFSREAAEIEREIVRKGIALGIDWQDAAAVRTLAHAAFAHKETATVAPGDATGLAQQELFGLIHLMLQVMTESAENDIRTHGGPVWKALARALWAERQALS
ncbi:hypothetical protein MASR1M60_27400 [Rhodocyclaceae bacterium]